MSRSDIEFFQASFVKIPALEKITSEPAVFIIGDKGSGKSAFATYFSNSLDSRASGLSIVFDKSDYDSFLAFQSEISNMLFMDYSNIWEVMFLLHLLSFKIQIDQQAKGELSEDLSVLANLLQRFGHDQPIERFSASFNLICWNRTDFFDALCSAYPPKTSRSVNLPLTMPADFRTYLTALKNFLSRLLRDSGVPTKTFLLFVDGLDVQAFHATGSDVATAHLQSVCIGGLVDAAWRVNKDLLLKHFDKFLRIVVLLRPDIFERVGLHNMGTKLADNAVYLDWFTRPKTYQASPLFSVANNLLRPLVSETEDPHSFSSPWFALFQDPVVTRSGKRRDSFVEVMYNSFYRPRDLVAFLEILRATTVELSGGNGKTFEVGLFRHSLLRDRYSQYLKLELKDAVSFYYRQEDFDLLEKLFEFLSGDLNSFEFKRSAFEKAYRRLSEYIAESGIEASDIYKNPDTLLQFLYEQNVVGAITTGGSGVPIAMFCVNVRNQSSLRPRVPSVDLYRLHGGVSRALYPSRIS